jgi:hypothetical protein
MSDGPAPWRKVTAVSGPRSGRGSLLGPDTTRRAHWWELELECGHRADRDVRFGPHKDGRTRQRGGTQHRSLGDMLPAPGRVRCTDCKAGGGESR